VATLTEREREVVGLVAAGRSSDEIAAELVLSPLTPKTHVSRAMTKLAARDRAQLVVIAYASGLAAPGSRRLHLPPRLSPHLARPISLAPSRSPHLARPIAPRLPPPPFMITGLFQSI